MIAAGRRKVGLTRRESAVAEPKLPPDTLPMPAKVFSIPKEDRQVQKRASGAVIAQSKAECVPIP